MTEENFNPAEEGIVDELLAGRSDPNEILRPVGGDETQREIRRECLEVLGLLAESLEPRQPSEDLKRALMAEVALLGALGAPGADDSTRKPTAPERPQPKSEEKPAIPEIPFSAPAQRSREFEPAPRGRWMLPLAATLAVVALGLAGWQASRVASLERTVARQTAELEEARERLAQIGDSADALASANAKLAVLTSPGSEFCPLKPGRDSRMRAARGTLVMHPESELWFLKVVGLEPSSEGFRYQVWYLTQERAVPAASFGFDSPDAMVEVMTSRGPAGVQAVMITLEPVGSEAPSSPALLYGDERMQIL